MHTLIILVLLAFGVSAFGSMVGAGGGFLLMPVLFLMFPAESPERLTFISLFAVLVNALTALFNYGRLGRVDFKSGLILGFCTIPTAVAARFLQGLMGRGTFGWIFGALLIAIGLFVVWRVRASSDPHGVREAKPKPNWFYRELRDRDGIVFKWAYNLRIAISVSLAEGFLASFFGIGGGILHMPIMTQILNFPPHVAAATSILVLSMSALAAVTTDVIKHPESVPIAMAALAGLGAFFGAQVGTRLARRVSGKKILYLLAVALMFAGGRLMLEKDKPETPPDAVSPPADAESVEAPASPPE